MLTSKEFAKMIGLSQSTVSRAMNDSPLVPEEKRRYIQQKAEELGFVLNSQARSLKTNKTSTIGVLFPVSFESLSKNMMLAHIYDLLQQELSRSEYDIMVVFDDQDPSQMNAFERVIKSRKVDGFAILRPRLTERETELLRNYSVPWIALFAAVQDERQPNQFMIDSEQAGFLAGDFYGRQDGWNYFFLTIADRQKDAQLRQRGFEQGLRNHGKTLSEDGVLVTEMSIERAYDIIRLNGARLQAGRAAFFVYNDMMAMGVVNALKDLDISIPDQAQVIGVDGIPHGTWMRPRLTTIQAPLEHMVRDSCNCLYRLIRGENVPKHRKLYPNQMILRETTLPTRT